MEAKVKARRARSRPESRHTSRTHVATHFGSECPVCGRRLLVLVEHLGRQVACGHCGCQFVAADPSTPAGVELSLLEKADQYLDPQPRVGSA